MPIVPQPQIGTLPTVAPVPPSEQWTSASFYDAVLVQMTGSLIASGKYAPGPLIMSLALALTAELMYQTGRWVRPAGMEGVTLTPEQAEGILNKFRITS